MPLIFTAIIFYSGIIVYDLNINFGKFTWMIHNFAAYTLLNCILWVIPRNLENFFKEIMPSFMIQKINILSFIWVPQWHSTQSPCSEPCSYTLTRFFFCSWNAEIWIYFRHICQLVITYPYRQGILGLEYANLVYWNYALRHRLPGWFKTWFICFCLILFVWQLLFAIHNLLDSDSASCVQSTTTMKVITWLKVLCTLRLTTESQWQREVITLSTTTIQLEFSIWYFLLLL